MRPSDNRQIGIFDSGLGGLTVLDAVHRLLPGEDIAYFGDSGRAPYGTKSKETIVGYTFQDINFLLSEDVKMIVIACNTASACSIDEVRKKYDIPVVEVVGPGARAAVSATKSGRIGVIGTNATVSSGVYERAIRKLMPDAFVLQKACPVFVPLVEEGWWDNDVAYMVAEKYLSELKGENIDTVVLGCTHYPYLSKVIADVMGSGVTLVNSAKEIAREVKSTLESNGSTCASDKRGIVSYYTSDSVEKFASLGSLFLGREMTSVERVSIERFPTDK